MPSVNREQVSQRSDLTFKYNRNLGRHGWLRLTPAYSVKLVRGLLETDASGGIILDPFSGTATTSLVASEFGINSYGFDINPFLIWLGRAKCNHYTTSALTEARNQLGRIIVATKDNHRSELWLPSIHNIERWWQPSVLHTLSALRASISEEIGEPTDENPLIWIGFCRLAIETSAAAFNHVSMSFREVTHFEEEQILNLFSAIMEEILLSSEPRLRGAAHIMQQDSSQDVPHMVGTVDRIITSPPYPNRISYIRELRPYMYWTRFLEEARYAAELDWEAIGGTWGVATSRLATWTPTSEIPPSAEKAAAKISVSESKNGSLLAKYVLKYFHDMHSHLAAMRPLLKPGTGRINYILGNSSFYGVVVDTPKLIGESLKALGYVDIRANIIRKRNSNKALYEYDISARIE